MSSIASTPTHKRKTIPHSNWIVTWFHITEGEDLEASDVTVRLFDDEASANEFARVLRIREIYDQTRDEDYEFSSRLKKWFLSNGKIRPNVQKSAILVGRMFEELLADEYIRCDVCVKEVCESNEYDEFKREIAEMEAFITEEASSGDETEEEEEKKEN